MRLFKRDTMKYIIIKLICLSILSSIYSCKTKSILIKEEKLWKQGWRMIGNSMENELELANGQFDSLLAKEQELDLKFLITGLEVKSKLNKRSEIAKIMETQNTAIKTEICSIKSLRKNIHCKTIPRENIDNKELQMEIVKMYVDDQASRGIFMDNIIAKYNIDTTLISKDSGVKIDEDNRNRLKEIISKHGFPTQNLVGKDAMRGVFFIIQHADMDKEWQKSQLKNIEKAVKNGDLDGQSFAYLYDRIKVNNGEKQLYGTQFSNVDPKNKTVELEPTKDLKNLDKRRREIGMMPIQMYKKLMLKNL